VPEEMQMAEIFGWKRGAFTGAHQDQDGCIAKSDGGTLFIDEVDKLSLRAQAGLLHLFETRRYRVLGDAGRLRPADVRFVVATSADLRAEVARGRFREDLYFRINVLPVRVPPLSERRDEIAGWARFILERRHREVRPDGVVHPSLGAERALVQLPWPGNIRQLDNVVRRAYALASVDDPTSGRALVLEREHVERALSFESEGPELPPLMASLRGAAADFIEHAIRRSEVGEPLSLDLTAAFRGLVLEAGVRRLGDLREVFRVVGCDAVLRSRNHSREYRRELAKIARVEEVLSAPPKPPGDPLVP
jgi:DNA-binding NtrC family response regulator